MISFDKLVALVATPTVFASVSVRRPASTPVARVTSLEIASAFAASALVARVTSAAKSLVRVVSAAMRAASSASMLLCRVLSPATRAATSVARSDCRASMSLSLLSISPSSAVTRRPSESSAA